MAVIPQSQAALEIMRPAEFLCATIKPAGVCLSSQHISEEMALNLDSHEAFRSTRLLKPSKESVSCPRTCRHTECRGQGKSLSQSLRPQFETTLTINLFELISTLQDRKVRHAYFSVSVELKSTDGTAPVLLHLSPGVSSPRGGCSLI